MSVSYKFKIRFLYLKSRNSNNFKQCWIIYVYISLPIASGLFESSLLKGVLECSGWLFCESSGISMILEWTLIFLSGWSMQLSTFNAFDCGSRK